MTDCLKVGDLAALKKIPEQTLLSFGLEQTDAGVVFRYIRPDGVEGRSRLRTALRGAEGSHWLHGDQRSITAYAAPAELAFDDSTEVVVVEGESDCWTAWLHRRWAVGVPGSDKVSALEDVHFAGAARVYIQKEKLVGSNRTYPRGVDHFVNEVVNRLRQLKFPGQILIATMPEPFNDISDMYVAQQDRFSALLETSLRAADAVPGNP